MDDIATKYVHIVLEIDTHEEGYVDAYYGPPEWKEASLKSPRSLEDLLSALNSLLVQFQSLPRNGGLQGDDEVVKLRWIFMEKQACWLYLLSFLCSC